MHREKFKPLGGPDGGNGGPGGSVILRVDTDVTTLVDYHHSPHRKAENGGHGAGSHKNGAHGADVVLPVPDGTLVSYKDGEVIADLVGPGTELVIAEGGRGGLGNAALASSKRKAPGFALLGEPGDELEIVLELKVVADIGLVGFPSAGKSSLIASISRARPKIADYPFTTLVPNLGVVTGGEVTFTVADVPGLIEGASDGRGLGHDFLRHVERCAALVHVLDTATFEPGRNPADDLDVIENELSRYGGLEDRPRLIALNKIDVPDGRDISDMVIEDLARPRPAGLPGLGGQRRGHPRADLRDGRDRLRGAGRAGGRGRPAHRAASAECRRQRRLHHHRDRRGLAGARRQAGALGPPDRLQQRRGRRVPRRPAQPARRRDPTGHAGRVEGDTVLIGHPDNAVVFDFKPGLDAGAENLARRGEDTRLEENRPARERRRAIEGAMDDRGENETRADVARRLDKPETYGPKSYEIGSEDDPDWAESDPGTE